LLREATEGTKELIQKAFTQASDIEKGDLAKLVGMLVVDASNLNDDKIKTMLKNATRMYSVLLSSELELSALNRALAKKSSRDDACDA
jgi:hypothetical protein